MTPTDVTELSGMTRRSAVGGVAVGAAALWAAPVVTALGSGAWAAGSPQPGSAPPATPFARRYDVEQDPYGLAVSGTLTDLTVSEGNIDVLRRGMQFEELVQDAEDGNSAADLAGDTASTVLTGNDVVPAGTYTVQVRIGGSARGSTNTVTVTLGSGSTGTITLSSGAPVQTLQFPAVVPAGGGTLRVGHVAHENRFAGALLYWIDVTTA